MKRFKKKIVLVTGGSRGLGAAMVRRFSDEGATVVINYANNRSAAESLADSLENKAIFIRADVAKEDQVENMIGIVEEKFGCIDVLINNAGIVYDQPFGQKTSETWQRTLGVNLNGVYFMTKHALPHLRRCAGTIVNIASTNGIDAYHPDSIDYDVSKAAVIHFTKVIALEAAPNVRVNCIAPGWFETDMNKDLPAEYIKGESEKIALDRFGKPEEIASVAAFLASKEANYITGSTIVVDGGYGGAL